MPEAGWFFPGVAFGNSLSLKLSPLRQDAGAYLVRCLPGQVPGQSLRGGNGHKDALKPEERLCSMAAGELLLVLPWEAALAPSAVPAAGAGIPA